VAYVVFEDEASVAAALEANMTQVGTAVVGLSFGCYTVQWGHANQLDYLYHVHNVQRYKHHARCACGLLHIGVVS
jgi:beta-phosphoglucomutase-like phosphatase (HAD superfamily)